MDRVFVSAVEPPADLIESEPAWWFAFRGAEILVVAEDPEASSVPYLTSIAELASTDGRQHYLGALTGRACYAVELDTEGHLPPQTALRPLRSLYGRMEESLYAIAGRAAQIVEWDRTHRFCGRCGMPTEQVPGERAKRCPACGQLSFPRLSPAIIVLVERGEEALLARGQQFPEAFYSTLAGFVEPGESLEEAVRREIFEEVAVDVEDVRYFGSQPWPYPHSLMIGFTARHAGGEIQIDEREIVDARWFTVDGLPRIPGKLSIARRLIDDFIQRHGGIVTEE